MIELWETSSKHWLKPWTWFKSKQKVKTNEYQIVGQRGVRL